MCLEQFRSNEKRTYQRPVLLESFLISILCIFSICYPIGSYFRFMLFSNSKNVWELEMSWVFIIIHVQFYVLNISFLIMSSCVGDLPSFLLLLWCILVLLIYLISECAKMRLLCVNMDVGILITVVMVRILKFMAVIK